jgi:hypothetical protein
MLKRGGISHGISATLSGTTNRGLSKVGMPPLGHIIGMTGGFD